MKRPVPSVRAVAAGAVVSGRSRRVGGGVALTVAGVLLVTGCGSTDDSNVGTSGGAAATSSYYSPLEEFLNPSAGSQPSTDEEYAAKEKQVQELVAPCMADEGFEYEPFVYPVNSGIDNSPYSADNYGTREWVEKYGYGISTMNDAATVTSSSEVIDPNSAIVEAMSDSERDAYYVALYGGGGGMAIDMSTAAGAEISIPESDTAATDAAGTDAASTDAASTDVQTTEAVPVTEDAASASADPESTDLEATSVPEASVDPEMSMPPLEDQGCWGKAQAEVYGDMNTGGGDQSQFQDMWDDMNNVYSQVESDSKVTAAVADWSGCMAGAGYPDLKAIYDANQQANDKWSELNGWPTSDGSGGAVIATSSAATSGGVPAGPPADQVATFREYELKIALADFDCKESSNYDTVSNEVRIGLEKQFVEDHRAELEQYRDTINGGG